MPRLFTFSTLILVSSLFCFNAKATHISGGEMSYKYMGNNTYEVTLRLAFDCLHSNEAISNDNISILLCAYNGNTMVIKDSLVRISNNTIPVETHGCDTLVSACYTEMVYKKVYNLPASNTPYTFAFQQCCRNLEVTNILNPGSNGGTYYCTIPASSTGLNNSSAVFKAVPLQCVCPGTPLMIDNSATDADGDSLSYEFATAYAGGDQRNTRNFASVPPFTEVAYSGNRTYYNPMDSAAHMELNATTGLLTATPDEHGVYLVTVACNEWRNGVKINTLIKEYEIMTTTEENHKYEFSVGPNPVSSEVMITLESTGGNSTLRIMDLAGRIINTMVLGQGTTYIDVSKWPPGIYFFEHRNEKNYSLIRVVKQ